MVSVVWVGCKRAALRPDKAEEEGLDHALDREDLVLRPSSVIYELSVRR